MAQSALIAADGKLGVGLGHISRCRALQAELESLGFEAKLVDTQELEEFKSNFMGFNRDRFVCIAPRGL